MNLSYRLLWFDDNREFFESLNVSTLYGAVSSWGFTLSIDFVESPKEFMNHAPFSDFDLLAVDYNLALDEQHGGDFVTKIREHGTYTEVIFYSNNPSQQLWDAIRDQQLEGVFIANRQGVLDKIERVGFQTIKKVLDVNNMRGLVMAEVGELDHAIDAIVRKGLSALASDQRGKMFSAFHDKAVKNAEEHNQRLTAFNAAPCVDGMLALCDSNKRWECLNRLKKAVPILQDQNVGDFPVEILGPRNFLAHGIPSPIPGGVRFSYNGKSYDFSEDVGIKLRKTILTYKETFGKLLESIADARPAEEPAQLPH